MILQAEREVNWATRYLPWHCVRKVMLNNDVDAWAFGLSQYIKLAVKNIEDYLEKQDTPNCWKMPTKTERPLKTMY